VGWMAGYSTCSNCVMCACVSRLNVPCSRCRAVWRCGLPSAAHEHCPAAAVLQHQEQQTAAAAEQSMNHYQAARKHQQQQNSIDRLAQKATCCTHLCLAGTHCHSELLMQANKLKSTTLERIAARCSCCMGEELRRLCEGAARLA